MGLIGFTWLRNTTFEYSSALSSTQVGIVLHYVDFVEGCTAGCRAFRAFFRSKQMAFDWVPQVVLVPPHEDLPVC